MHYIRSWYRSAEMRKYLQIVQLIFSSGMIWLPMNNYYENICKGFVTYLPFSLEDVFLEKILQKKWGVT